MLVILPFHAGDKAQAVILANWIRELAGDVFDPHRISPEDKCLICPADDCDETGVEEPLRDCFGFVSVFHTRTKVKPGDGVMGYARAANAMWQSVAWKIHFNDKCPWLWLEPDAIPTRPSWLREIETSYQTNKKPFMGFKTVVKHPPPKKDVIMLNGVAVYPASVCDYAPLALQAGDCAWDQNAGEQILKYAHVSDLFQNIYLIEGQPPTFPKDKDRLLPATALFHRCKDGTLIAYLKEHGYTPTLSGGVEKPHETRWQAGIDRPEASEQSQPKAQLSGSDVSPRQSRGGSVPPTQDDSELMGEPVDYAEKLDRARLAEINQGGRKIQVPKEGDRFGELIWRGGKWHTATEVVERPKADRKAVMEKYKHPQKEDLPVPVLAEPKSLEATRDITGATCTGSGEAKGASPEPESISGPDSAERRTQPDSGGGQNDLLQGKGGGKQTHQGDREIKKEPEEPGSPSPELIIQWIDKGEGSAYGSVPRTDAIASAPPASPDNLSGGAKPPICVSDNDGGSVATQAPSAQTRHDMIEEAVAVLKLLCTSPHAISKVRKELKKQKVTK